MLSLQKQVYKNVVFMMICHIIYYRNSVRLAIRKLTYAPEEPAPQPSAETSKDFMMSPGNMKLEASLDKEVRTAVTFHLEFAADNIFQFCCFFEKPYNKA